MELTCSNCDTRYRIHDEKVPPGGAWATCRNCGQIIPVPAVEGSRAAPGPLTGSAGADFGQTIAYDFSGVDQSGSEASALLEELSGTEPFIREGSEVIVKEVQTGEQFRLGSPTVTVGRSGSDVNLSDPEVSRQHSRISVFGDRFVVTDLGSTNGTFYQGRKVMTVKLGTGERFTLGNTTLEIEVRNR